jgi:hypothetical protein
MNVPRNLLPRPRSTLASWNEVLLRDNLQPLRRLYQICQTGDCGLLWLGTSFEDEYVRSQDLSFRSTNTSSMRIR